MTLILDSGGLTALARDRARLTELARRQLWPPEVPTVVLVEALTGDHRRDHPTNRLLQLCQVHPVSEVVAREAARLRTLTGQAGRISATDAIVAAFAAGYPDPVVLTSDARDLGALAAQCTPPIRLAIT